MTGRFSFKDLYFVLSAVLIIAFSSFSAFAESSDGMPEKVLRLHILANSDSEYDQSIKYDLRDYMLKTFSDIFKDCSTLSESINSANDNILLMEKSANEFLRSRGYSKTVACSVEKCYFTTRKYENYTLPAGWYNAVRMVIGEGNGRNWWCVMFPPLCLPAASGDAYFTEEQSKRIEENRDYELRFALFEFLSSLFSSGESESTSYADLSLKGAMASIDINNCPVSYDTGQLFNICRSGLP